MKQTTFRFDLRIGSAAPDDFLEKLKETLSNLKNVQSIETAFDGHVTELAVRVCFNGPDEAKELHEMVLKEIVGQKYVTISAMTSRISDIF